MTPIREQIFAALKATLEGVPGFTVLRNPRREVRDNQMPALVLFDGGQNSPALWSGAKQFRATASVEIYVTGPEDDLGAALNEAYAQVVQALEADPTLGGLALHVEEGQTIEPEVPLEEGWAAYMGTAVEFTVTYETAERDPYTAG
jgi:hypothetical protein